MSSSSLDRYKWVPGDSSLSPKAELFLLTFHRLKTSLDATRQGTYQVTVQAQDRPSVGPALEANITLNVSSGPCLQPWYPLPARESLVPHFLPCHLHSSSLWIRVTV